MHGKEITAGEAGFLLFSALRWCTAALAALCFSSLVLSFSPAGAGIFGYVSSGISFIAAAAAGGAAANKRGKGGIMTGLICGTALTAALLTVGFMIEGSSLSADGVLSVAAFTLSGCIFGSTILPPKKKRGKIHGGIKKLS